MLFLRLQEFARVADAYGDGTARLTPEENILFVNVPDDKLQAMLADPLFQKFKVNPGTQGDVAIAIVLQCCYCCIDSCCCSCDPQIAAVCH